jgi:uncharacterized protein YigE (DUF2233 family)
MRALALLFIYPLASCQQADTPAVAREDKVSPCTEQMFDGNRFIACRAEGAIEIISGHRGFAELGEALGDRASYVAFAMNAGMFDEAGAPIGLMVEEARQVKAINRRKGGGNFHLMPNGVFMVRRDGSAAVVASQRINSLKDIVYATQSGPMLLIDGKLHPEIDEDGTSRHIRNAVGIASDGQPVFVISREPVSFGKLARFYRNELGARDALYLDGAVSSLWDPANDRMDAFTELGPLVVAFRPAAESAPDPSTRAKP